MKKVNQKNQNLLYLLGCSKSKRKIIDVCGISKTHEGAVQNMHCLVNKRPSKILAGLRKNEIKNLDIVVNSGLKF